MKAAEERSPGTSITPELELVDQAVDDDRVALAAQRQAGGGEHALGVVARDLRLADARGRPRRPGRRAAGKT